MDEKLIYGDCYKTKIKRVERDAYYIGCSANRVNNLWYFLLLKAKNKKGATVYKFDNFDLWENNLYRNILTTSGNKIVHLTKYEQEFADSLLKKYQLKHNSLLEKLS